MALLHICFTFIAMCFALYFFWSFSMSYSFLLPEHMTSHMKVTTHLVLDFFCVCVCVLFLIRVDWCGFCETL